MNAKRIAALVFLALLGCPKATEPIPTPPPAVVKSFSATPKSVARPGDKVTLTWDTSDAKRITLEQVGKGPVAIDPTQAAGAVQVPVNADTTFVLTAIGEGGTDSAVQSVMLEGSAGSFFFDASKKTLMLGESTTLVWNAPGATAVAIRPQGGMPLDLKGQTASGSILVTPAATTTYELTAGVATASVTITVLPRIVSFTASPSPQPGQPVTLSWVTTGGAKLTVFRDGITSAVHTETAAATVAMGSFVENAPNLPAEGVVGYRLVLEQGMNQVTAAVTVRIRGTLAIDAFTVPAFVRTGLPFSVSWQANAASSLDLQLDGRVVYVAPDQASVNGGGASLPPVMGAMATVKLTVRNDRGGEVTDQRTVEPVGDPTFNSFTADKMSIANGGEPVVLSWNVTNARDVRISQTGVGLVHAAAGHVDTGTVTVYPNKSTSEFVLNATNGAGVAVPAATLSVTVTAIGTLTFESLLPVGAMGRVTGHTVMGGGAIHGLPVVVKNQPGDAFVDIASSGFLVNHVTDAVADTTDLPEPVNMVLFGRRINGATISTSPNGWFMFSATAIDGPNSSSPIGTVLEPLAIAPYFRDLAYATGSETYGRFDTVGNDRRFIIQWVDMTDNASSSSRLTFQAQLYSSGKVVFAYAKLDGIAAVNGAIGIVNGSENQVLSFGGAPAVGDTFTFFGPAMLPHTMVIDNAPYVARVAIGTGFVEVAGDGRLTAGQFAITEANPFPAAAVTTGEWLEVTNFTSNALNLNGWTLSFGGMNMHTITTSVPLPPNGRILLAQAMDLGEPTAGLTAAYVYPSTLTMPDTGGSVSLDIGGAAYTRLSWTAASVPAAGAAARADRPSPTLLYASGATQVVCAAGPSQTYGANGQLGTPGAANGSCFPYTLAPLAVGAFQSITTTGAKVSGTAADEEIYTVTLPTPVRYYGANVTTLYVGANGWLSTTLTTGDTYTNKVSPSTTAPAGSIAPFWDDLENGAAADWGVYWQQLDPDMMAGSGDEYTLVSWEHVKLYGSTYAGQDLSFQVKLLANGDLEYHYGTMMAATSGGTTHQGSGATSWLEHREAQAALSINVNSTMPGIAPNTGFKFAYAP